MEEGVLSRFVGGDEDVPMAEETRRLAVVDLEWDRIRAVDIFAARILRGAAATGGGEGASRERAPGGLRRDSLLCTLRRCRGIVKSFAPAALRPEAAPTAAHCLLATGPAVVSTACRHHQARDGLPV